MYVNYAYLNNSWLPMRDKSRPLVVNSCGVYRLVGNEKLPTWWKGGRVDYQLLYVASGKAHFYFGGKETEVTAGHMVLFRPKEEQHYEYFAKDKPEVYWIHFTGADVKKILASHGFARNDKVIHCGSSSNFAWLYKEIIHELQSCREGYREMTEMYLLQLLTHVMRSRQERIPELSSYMQDSIVRAIRYFGEHYNESLCIEDYAKSQGMSVSWFLRNFKRITGSSPMQYILSLRLDNAAALLEATEYNITEIAAIVGYDNPLYFSRLFKRHKGLPPREYRDQERKEKIKEE